MRIAFLPDGVTANAMYRSIGPMTALAMRGHDVRELDTDHMDAWHDILRWCELLHIHRVCDDGVVRLARAARAAGAAVVWDDDDDVTRIPRAISNYAEVGGMKGRQRLAARTRLFETIDLVTTPSPALAQTFAQAGAPHVRVIENYAIEARPTARPTHAGLTIGWVAGEEHKVDLPEIPIEHALQRLLDIHTHLRVHTIGLRLALESDRYQHTPAVPFPELPHHIAHFDVGIAPLSPAWEISRARSNIKLKEYASIGVPWLASPIGPYAGLGERQGGRLVNDDRWYEELDALIRGDRARRKLAKRAKRWGEEQQLQRNVGQWQTALTDTIERARGERLASLATQKTA